MPEEAIAAPVSPAISSEPAPEAPQSVSFDFGDGETLEGSFAEEPKPKEQKAREWDKELETKYSEHEEFGPHVKQWKDDFYRAKSASDTLAKGGFKSPQEAIQYKQSVDELGESFRRDDGLTGIEAIKAEAQDWARMYSGLATGDVSVAKAFFDANPEALGKLTPNLMELWRSTDQAGYNHSGAKMLLSFLSQPDSKTGITAIGALQQLYDAVGDNAAAKKWLDIVAGNINQLAELANKQPEAKPLDFAAKQKEIAAKERKNVFDGMNNKAAPLVDKGIQQSIKVLLGSRKIDDDTMAKIRDEVAAEFFKLQSSDNQYQKNMQDLLASGDEGRILRMVKAKIAKSMPQAAAMVMKKYSAFGPKLEAKSEAGAGGARTGPKIAKWTGEKAPNGGPLPTVVDTRRTTDEMLEKGQFYVWPQHGDKDTIYSW